MFLLINLECIKVLHSFYFNIATHQTHYDLSNITLVEWICSQRATSAILQATNVPDPTVSKYGYVVMVYGIALMDKMNLIVVRCLLLSTWTCAGNSWFSWFVEFLSTVLWHDGRDLIMTFLHLWIHTNIPRIGAEQRNSSPWIRSEGPLAHQPHDLSHTNYMASALWLLCVKINESNHVWHVTNDGHKCWYSSNSPLHNYQARSFHFIKGDTQYNVHFPVWGCPMMTHMVVHRARRPFPRGDFLQTTNDPQFHNFFKKIRCGSVMRW